MELICSVQKYHWGSKGNESLVGKFAEANSNLKINPDESYAEFWMGTHPSGPSYLKNNNLELSAYLSSNPEALGTEVISKFGKNLPFLFKILSVEKPLSIQAHPTKSLAEKLFIQNPDLYKDGNHKPEIAIAVSKFEALCGFRPKVNIQKFLKEIDEFHLLIEKDKLFEFLNTPNDDNFKECFKSLMSNQDNVVAKATGN